MFVLKLLESLGMAGRFASDSAHDWHNPQVRRHSDLLAFIQKLGIKANSEILDLGCGNGRLAGRLKAAGFVNVDGVDWLDPKNVDGSAFRSYFRHDLNSGDSLEHVLSSKRYDLVISSDVIEHLEAPAQFLRTARACLQPHGDLVLTLPNTFNLFERALLMVTGSSSRYPVSRPEQHGHISFLPNSVLISLGYRAGLRIHAKVGGGAFVAGYSLFPTLNFGPWLSYSVIYHLKCDGAE